MRNLIFIFFITVFFFSCQNRQKADNDSQLLDTYEIRYAKGFNIKKYVDFTEVTVNNPWDSTRVLQKYILVDKAKDLPAGLPDGKIIRTPLEDIVVYSTIHCTVLNEFNLLSIIRGVCEPQYIDIDYIIDGIKNGDIIDLGQASNPNVEKIIMLDPEAIFATPIQGTAYGTIEKTGVPMIETPDYMEQTPLARTEWLKFYSVFIGKQQMADSLFNAVERKYNEIKGKVAQVKERPTVFSDMKYGNAWYIAGGKSYMSHMFNDAGASYVWADDHSAGSTPLTYEEVLDKAGDAQFWLIKYNNKEDDLTYDRLQKEFKPYSYFAAFKNRNIYACNSGKVTYYEDLPVHPEYILQDIAYIFHPELFEGYVPRYFIKMKE